MHTAIYFGSARKQNLTVTVKQKTFFRKLTSLNFNLFSIYNSAVCCEHQAVLCFSSTANMCWLSQFPYMGQANIVSITMQGSCSVA